MLQRRIYGKVILSNLPGGNIEIQVVYIDKDRVRLGITAPPEVRVDREEVYRKRQEEGDEAR